MQHANVLNWNGQHGVQRLMFFMFLKYVKILDFCFFIKISNIRFKINQCQANVSMINIVYCSAGIWHKQTNNLGQPVSDRTCFKMLKPKKGLGARNGLESWSNLPA